MVNGLKLRSREARYRGRVDTIMMCRSLVATVLLVLSALLGCGDKTKRLPESGFQAAFESHKVAAEMNSGKTVAADITVKNISPVTWPSKPDNENRYAVNLSYHWLTRKGEMVVFDGLRTPLPRDLKAGESVALKAAIQAPDKPGRYLLEVTLVQERSAWFPEKNGAKLVIPVTVSESSEISAGTPSPSLERPHIADAGKAPSKQNGAVSSPAGAVDRGGGRWSVQLGSYAEKKVAASWVKKLQDRGYDAYVTPITVKGKELYQVRVGRFEQRAEAEKLRETLRKTEKLERAVVANR